MVPPWNRGLSTVSGTAHGISLAGFLFPWIPGMGAVMIAAVVSMSAAIP